MEDKSAIAKDITEVIPHQSSSVLNFCFLHLPWCQIIIIFIVLLLAYS